MDEEGAAIPVISFSIHGKRGLYVMCTHTFGWRGDCLFIATKFKTSPITGGMLNDHDDIRIDFNGYVIHVYRLEDFIERIKHYG